MYICIVEYVHIFNISAQLFNIITRISNIKKKPNQLRLDLSFFMYLLKVRVNNRI